LPSARRKFPPLASALAGLVLLMVLAGFLNYYYRASRQARAQQDYQVGNELLQQGRYDEAIEQFRNALSITHSLENRRALGLALVKAGRLEEGALYLNEVVRERPDDGPAQLGLAEIAAQKGQVDAAISHYRRAIDGSWPQNAQENRLEARIALVKTLANAARRTQAQEELLSLAAEIPPQPAWQRRVAKMLADYGLPQQAAALYREVLHHNRQDTDAWYGLGEEEFTLGDFAAAKQAFQQAVDIDSTDAAAKMRIALCDEILALDPVLPGLKAADRYQRSRELLMRVIDRVRDCNPAALPEAQAALSQRRPASFSDAAEANITLAERLWADTVKTCGKFGADDPLAQLMATIPRAPAR
jgi:tetratricopeptide (TPR) repeat protein